jgi:hypothetical protein
LSRILIATNPTILKYVGLIPIYLKVKTFKTAIGKGYAHWRSFNGDSINQILRAGKSECDRYAANCPCPVYPTQRNDTVASNNLIALT